MKRVMQCGLPWSCSPELGVFVEEHQAVLAALGLLTRAGGLGRRALGGVGCLGLAHQSWGVLVKKRQEVLAAWDFLTRAGGLG